MIVQDGDALVDISPEMLNPLVVDGSTSNHVISIDFSVTYALPLHSFSPP